jgi:alkylation response protein AidB-like acyl-CoA dehydrogenase
MDFNHNEDRRMLASTLSRYVREQYDFETRMEIAGSDTGYSAEKWAEFAELGIIAALFDEEDGGFGGKGYDLMVVFEELGRGIVVEPFLSSAVLGGGLIASLGNDTQKAMLDDVIAGTKLFALAHGEAQSRYGLSDVQATGQSTGNGYVLNGHKAVVIGGGNADTLIVSARTSGGRHDREGISLFVVDANASGVVRRPYATVDGGNGADIWLENVEVGADALLGAEGGAFEAIEAAVARATLALSAEALGAMEVVKDITLDYLRTRKQFGIPIGKFQALQHRMADLLMEVEQARSIVINAAGQLEADRDTREKAVSAAKNLIGRIGRLVAEESIQMHGGIGMTWEYNMPHFAKHIIMIDHMFGDTDHHMERFIELSKAS